VKELHILNLMLKLGYQGKDRLASDLGVSARTVARLLSRLHDFGLITREGKGYTLMHEGRKLAEGWKGPSGNAGPQTRLG
jgi:Mn-dependent DtxR family transcriptional regulator